MLTEQILQSRWQTQSDAVLRSRSIFKISEETNESIHGGDNCHSDVQHATRFAKVFRCVHVVFQSNHNANGFKGKQNGSEVKWETFDGCKLWDCVEGWKILENVVKCETQTDECKEIG